MSRRFKASETSRKTTYSGTITIADLRKRFNIPEKATVSVRVPSGGDWSGEDLEISNDVPINVTWDEWRMIDEETDGNDLTRKRPR